MINFQLVSEDGERNLVLVDGEGNILPPIHDSHSNFSKILELLISEAYLDDPDQEDYLMQLIDIERSVKKKFDKLSDRVSVAGGKVHFDNEPVDSSITRQIVRFLDEDLDFMPLVYFFEKIQTNPNEHSKRMLYDWLAARDFTITSTGDFIGYKGVNKSVDGSLVSGYAGKAIVDGEEKDGHIPNEVGSTIEMPRNEVVHDPHDGCSYGLHVGTYGYARSYANGAMLKVVVNPRDVVSVPVDGAGEKMRVCRYSVVEVIDAPETSALSSYGRSEERDYDYWGDTDGFNDESDDWYDDDDLYDDEYDEYDENVW